ncbi:MAG: hypothetical protein Q8L60_07555 [Gammaproteobacteria bacterium]|nr:hypothetical protein [Gammaproteobacteria bacterium]MDP2348208.1 hypothetical protein [Gammaproteobacteria bacterium]
MVSQVEHILILAKTYPSPSAQHVETSCVAGITDKGLMRRLYPLSFRFIEESNQFRKWQWIDVRVEKATKDHRPESHRVYVDTIQCRDVLETRQQWADRRPWIDRIPYFDNMESIDGARVSEGISLGLLHPGKILGLDITPARNVDWTDEEKEKLLRAHMQGELFSELDARREIRHLRKIPFDFHYRYLCDMSEGAVEYRHKIVDWEVGMLYWNCQQTYGKDWEAPFRNRLEDKLPGNDLMFLMGNQHRFQDQWLIISLIYPPRLPPEAMKQTSLF